MSDNPPLMFAPRLGGLFPASPAAEKAMADIQGKVRVKITRMQGNSRRMALYWCVLAVAAPMLSEMCQGDAIDEAMLHRVLKDRRGLYTETVLPSGEVLKNYDSISFAKMAEPDRNAYVQWAFKTLAKWLKCSVEELTAAGQDT